MKNFRYLIIGNSAAGITAAESIREVDPKGSIAIVSDEPYHTYSRALIAHFLSGHTPVERMKYRPDDFYTKLNITPILGSRVVALDPKKRTATLDTKETVSYGDCLLATGGKPFVPKMDGLDLRGVTTFLSLDDAKKLDTLLDGAKRVVVIGGGLIGMQAAEAMNKRKYDVTVVELLGRVLGLVLDPAAALFVEDEFRGRGVRLMTGHSVTAILPSAEDPSRVGGVRLSNGEQLPADVVVVAIGVLPRIELLAGTNVKTQRGVVVDRHMRTTVPHLYAAGDVAEVHDYILDVDRALPIWPSATYGGRAAGRNMAGKTSDFPGITGMNAADFFDYPVISAGITSPKPEDNLEILLRHEPERRYVAKLYLKDNVIRGMVFAGDAVDRSGVYYSLMRDAVDVSAFRDKLLSDDFNFLTMPEELRRERIA